MKGNLKIHQVAEMLDKRSISHVELMKTVISNAEENKHTNAYITTCFDEALEKAKEQDGKNRENALSGIPVAVKDNICTKGLLTTAASRVLEGFIPPYDATVVSHLKESGAVITGKTNMDEFGMGAEGTKSGFAQMSNPIDGRFVVGGSSGGSVISVKCTMALGALGTDTGGSVRQPASFCGLFGLKPTYSLVSRYGLIAFASSLDTIGPICNSAKDCAIMLDAMAGFDKMDSTSARVVNGRYSDGLDDDIKGIRIGIPKEFYENADEDVKKAVLEAVDELKKHGAIVMECSFKALKYAVSAYYIISSAEASSNLARFDAVRFGKRSDDTTLEKMYEKSRSEGFGDEVKRRILLGTFALSEGYCNEFYKKAKAAQREIKMEFNRLFEAFDVLITPTSPVRVWQKGEAKGIKAEYNKDVCTVPVSLAGLPAISVPCGVDENSMPVGMQIIGNSFEERKILRLAHFCEKMGVCDNEI